MKKEIQILEGIFVSEFGMVRNVNGKTAKEKDWNFGTLGRFGSLTIKNPKTMLLEKIEKLVAEAFIPNEQNFTKVEHIDGDKSNNSIYNLKWVFDETGKEKRVDVFDPIVERKKYEKNNYGRKKITKKERGKVKVEQLDSCKYNRKTKKWTVTVVENRDSPFLGFFAMEKEAKEVFEKERVKIAKQ